MIQIKKETYPEDFIYNYIPKIYRNLLLSDVAKNKKRPIFKYLKDNYNISINKLISIVANSLSYNSNNNFILIDLDSTHTYNNTKLKTLVNLIDYGNLDVQGLNIFHSNMNFLSSRLYSIYLMYYMNKKGE